MTGAALQVLLFKDAIRAWITDGILNNRFSLKRMEAKRIAYA